MATVIKCDRCGAKSAKQVLKVRIFTGFEKEIGDVCDNCYQSFVNWWKSVSRTAD